jgi:imidazolonepropionase-like amidohydrolase
MIKQTMFLKNIIVVVLFFAGVHAYAQEHMPPASAQNKTIAITNATIHVGNGSVINQGVVIFKNGKITQVGANISTAEAQEIIDASGKHVYPGLIATCTNLGLVEVGSIRATQDSRELGDMNPSMQAVVAYNTDSKVINTLRSNGILLAHIVPQGGTLSGSSSVVQLDAWNYEDALYKKNNGMHLNMPALVNRPSFGGRRDEGAPTDALKTGMAKVEEIKMFFKQAKAYYNNTQAETNLKYEAVKNLFNKTQKLFVHCDFVREMLVAIDIKKEFDIDIVLVDAADSWMIADILKQQNIPVILSEPHSLPTTADDAVDQPYKTAAQLQHAGVLYTFSQNAGDGFWQQRCIPFQAGTIATYGLTKEQALGAITLNAAKILGIDKQTGSIEVGKDANLVISSGDILDMQTSNVIAAYIQGRNIDLNNKHTELYQKYKTKYGIK